MCNKQTLVNHDNFVTLGISGFSKISREETAESNAGRFASGCM
jgi:hypothetical protein